MDIVKTVIICVFWVAFVGCSNENEVEQVRVEKIPAIDSLIQKEIAADHIPGAVIQVKKGDSILHHAAYGFAQKYSFNMQPMQNPEPMSAEHLFDLASLTKVTATTFGIMKLVDEDKIQLEDPIYTYLPEFKKGRKSKITIRHLVSHTSGLPQWKSIYYHVSNPDEITKYISDQSLKWEVGKGRHYSDLGFMLLAKIIEEVSGQRLNNYLQKKIYKPLGLQHTVFNPTKKGFKKIAATSQGNPFEKQMVYDNDFGYNVDVEPESWDEWRQYTLRGEVNDGNAWYANRGVAGHAGLFSTVKELQILIDLLLDGGRFQDKHIISEAVIDTFLTKDRFGNALGWAMDKNFISAKGSPKRTFGHTGFTGTNIVAVPRDSLSIILLTNRQHVGRQENGYYFDLDSLRQTIFDVVQQRK
ncbi:CubicO group peptidase, beta-lactamase class C family [Fodinibius salinus]|uniref:CubicO group peptidase, beta-lactamase class C family n=1 Tax=Fodinibius salinus TaxID=860790 RepID=A0A5D3YKQ4_9BACT|nr:serine hydrolase [Fodinibius salinus]TYP94075.1 CubicO group peptidase, beta-lactamase class C family [Fodinibius salinus]